MLKEMIHKTQQQGKHTKLQDTSAHKKVHNEMFKDTVVRFRDTLHKKIEKKKKINLAKINKISIKSKRI